MQVQTQSVPMSYVVQSPQGAVTQLQFVPQQHQQQQQQHQGDVPPDQQPVANRSFGSMTQNVTMQQQQQQQQPSQEKSGRACRHFQRGRCTWGDQCRFAHRIDPDMSNSGNFTSGSYGNSAGGGVPGSLLMASSGSGGATQLSMSAAPFYGAQAIIAAPSSQQGGITYVTANGQAIHYAASPQQIYAAAPTAAPMLQSGGLSVAGLQQAQLQLQRHSILRAALAGNFVMTSRDPMKNDAKSVIVSLSNPPIGEIAVELLDPAQVPDELAKADRDASVSEGGLHYLIGEPALFWSLVKAYLEARTTGSSKWDALLAAARQGLVECMFHRSRAGCLSGSNCPFSHKAVIDPLALLGGSAGSAFKDTIFQNKEGFNAMSNGRPLLFGDSGSAQQAHQHHQHQQQQQQQQQQPPSPSGFSVTGGNAPTPNSPLPASAAAAAAAVAGASMLNAFAAPPVLFAATSPWGAESSQGPTAASTPGGNLINGSGAHQINVPTSSAPIAIVGAAATATSCGTIGGSLTPNTSVLGNGSLAGQPSGNFSLSPTQRAISGISVDAPPTDTWSALLGEPMNGGAAGGASTASSQTSTPLW